VTRPERTRSERAGRPVVATRNSLCDRCGGQINPGDLIRRRNINGYPGTVHALCDEVD